jgi:hypothetical protein
MGQAESPRGAGANKSIRRGGRFNDSITNGGSAGGKVGRVKGAYAPTS